MWLGHVLIPVAQECHHLISPASTTLLSDEAKPTCKKPFLPPVGMGRKSYVD